MSDQMKMLPPNRAAQLDNCACLYCGIVGTDEAPLTIEHVVGRRFVPRGSLANSWALIGNACNPCNGKKAELEDDISAITLQPDLGERHDDPLLAAEAARKAKGSFSRRTKKIVGRSQEEGSVEGKMMSNIDVKFSFVSPPQLIEKRVHELAQMHLQGFFYLMSYDEDERRGGFLPGTVGFVANANRPDWGNPLLRGFATLTKEWPQQLDCICANGFFKVAMRRESEESPVWSFALEWNRSHRVIGFFGDLHQAQAHVDALPELQWKRLDATSRYRMETALAPEEDTLFSARLAQKRT